jgi:enolase-phosphatase E1
LGDPAAVPVRAVLTDIEGTTTPIAFVRDVLFPYARSRLGAFLADPTEHDRLRPILEDIAQLAPGQAPEAALRGWMDQDAKVTPLKALQGLIWERGYADGSLHGALYRDVAPALRFWQAAGLRLFVYSSGSVAAQRLLFGHSAAGNLLPLFEGFFDTATGPKQQASSYAAIAAAIGVEPLAILFLSDMALELDAAAGAGLRTCQLVRPQDGTEPSARHPAAADFPSVARISGLPVK